MRSPSFEGWNPLASHAPQDAAHSSRDARSNRLPSATTSNPFINWGEAPSFTGQSSPSWGASNGAVESSSTAGGVGFTVASMVGLSAGRQSSAPLPPIMNSAPVVGNDGLLRDNEVQQPLIKAARWGPHSTSTQQVRTSFRDMSTFSEASDFVDRRRKHAMPLHTLSSSSCVDPRSVVEGEGNQRPSIRGSSFEGVSTTESASASSTSPSVSGEQTEVGSYGSADWSNGSAGRVSVSVRLPLHSTVRRSLSRSLEPSDSPCPDLRTSVGRATTAQLTGTEWQPSVAGSGRRRSFSHWQPCRSSGTTLSPRAPSHPTTTIQSPLAVSGGGPSLSSRGDSAGGDTCLATSGSGEVQRLDDSRTEAVEGRQERQSSSHDPHSMSHDPGARSHDQLTASSDPVLPDLASASRNVSSADQPRRSHSLHGTEDTWAVPGSPGSPHSLEAGGGFQVVPTPPRGGGGFSLSVEISGISRSNTIDLNLDVSGIEVQPHSPHRVWPL